MSTDIGARVRAARKERDISQEKLAHSAGMSTGTLAKLELGRIQDPHVSTLQKLADALGVSFEHLYASDSHTPPPSSGRRTAPLQAVDTVPVKEDAREYIETLRAQGILRFEISAEDGKTFTRDVELTAIPETWVAGIARSLMKLDRLEPGDRVEIEVEISLRGADIEPYRCHLSATAAREFEPDLSKLAA